MPNINPIEGPIGPKEDSQKREQKIGTPEKFKEQYRIQAVEGTDTEAETKKKRKKSQADADDEETEGIIAPTPTTGPLAPSPLEVQSPGKKVSSSIAADTGQTSVPYDKSYTPSGPSFTSLGDEGDTDDSFTSNLPNAPTPAPSTSDTTTTQQPVTTQQAQTPNQGMNFSEEDFITQQQTPSTTSDQNYPTAPSTTTTTPTGQTSSSLPTSTIPSQATPVPAVGKALSSKEAKTGGKAPGPVSAEKGKAASAPALPSTTPSEKLQPTGPQAPSPQALEQKQAQTPQPAPGQVVAPPPTPKTKELTPEEAGISWEDELPPVAGLTSQSAGEGKKEGGDKDKDEAAAAAQALTATPEALTPFAIDTSGVTQGALPTYTTFSPAVLDMFEKMVGTISVLQETSGERKTTITLTSPNFVSSAFYGAEIVIEEDLHLAPGQYNIRLVGSPEAVSLFQAKSDDLLAAFHSGNYNFKVQRLETSIQSTDKSLFKRKEGVGGDSGAGQGNTP